ncbi:hypothetical protein MKW92_045580 [Papaver armeniacum]|nr:hypothetical protein MKW92_045580 [Papaver armeniacum]
MTREICVGPEQTREGEVWFRVEGKDLCFCKADFKAVTGLPFKESGEEIELKGVSHLKKKHFEDFKKGAGADALRNPILSGKSKKRSRKFRKREPVPCSSDERVKVALLLMVHVFILGCQLQHKVEDQDWLSVENLEHFNRIPWGLDAEALPARKRIEYERAAFP